MAPLLQLPSWPSYSWTDGLQSVLLNPVQTWVSDHPLVAWLVLHPLWMLALVVGVMLFFAGLWSAAARLTEGFWLALVGLPLRLVTWLFTGPTLALAKSLAKSPPAPAPADRLGEIVARLEALQTEQETLLQEMRQLLAKRH